MLENIVLIRNILYKCFFIGFAFLLLSSLFFLFGQDYAFSIWSKFYGISPEILKIIMISFLGLFKLLLFVFFLIPALALHCKGRCLKKKVE